MKCVRFWVKGIQCRVGESAGTTTDEDGPPYIIAPNL